MRGKFIVFEGIDGCGKSTQLWLLTKHISGLDKHHHLLITREPYKNREIRKILRQEESPESQAETLAKLFTDDRKEHTKDLILPNLEKGSWVLSDRYKFSTICFQNAQGLSFDYLIKLHEGLPIPEITFIIDLPAEISRQRMKQDDVSIRGKEHKFEKSIEFQEKVRQNYLKMKELFPNENIFIINGDRNAEEIAEEIKSILNKHFSQTL